MMFFNNLEAKINSEYLSTYYTLTLFHSFVQYRLFQVFMLGKRFSGCPRELRDSIWQLTAVTATAVEYKEPKSYHTHSCLFTSSCIPSFKAKLCNRRGKYFKLLPLVDPPLKSFDSWWLLNKILFVSPLKFVIKMHEDVKLVKNNFKVFMCPPFSRQTIDHLGTTTRLVIGKACCTLDMVEEDENVMTAAFCHRASACGECGSVCSWSWFLFGGWLQCLKSVNVIASLGSILCLWTSAALIANSFSAGF